VGTSFKCSCQSPTNFFKLSFTNCFSKLKNVAIIFANIRQFGSLKQLKTLWLDDNQLSELPICLCQLDGLTTLRLSGNDLSSMPNAISSLIMLEVLVSSQTFQFSYAFILSATSNFYFYVLCPRHWIIIH
jgi:Leucine-rich repeat (LRR) protein